jgi:hypothetical protein
MYADACMLDAQKQWPSLTAAGLPGAVNAVPRNGERVDGMLTVLVRDQAHTQIQDRDTCCCPTQVQPDPIHLPVHWSKPNPCVEVCILLPTGGAGSCWWYCWYVQSTLAGT